MSGTTPDMKMIFIHRLPDLLVQQVFTECFCVARTVPGARTVLVSVTRKGS